jgi:hypothetical protein
MTKKVHKKVSFFGDNRMIFWLFILVVVAFIISLILNRLMIMAAVQQDFLSLNGYETKTENIGIKQTAMSTSNIDVSNRVASESKVQSLDEFQKSFNDQTFMTSPNGKSYAYIVTNSSTTKKTVVLDGVPGATYDDILFMKFSPNSQRFAYGAKINGKSLIVLDGKEGKTYDWIFLPHFFTPDDQYFVYKTRTDQGDILVFNSWESQPYERIYGITINNSESKLIYYARKNDNIWKGEVSLNKPLESNESLKNISDQGQTN